MDPILEAVGENIRRLRVAQGRSQEELAAEIGLETGILDEMERGLADPALSTLDALADGLGVRTADLLEPPRGEAG